MTPEEILKQMCDVMPFHLDDCFKPYLLEALQLTSTPRFKEIEWKGNVAFCGKVEIGSIENDFGTWIMFDHNGYEFDYVSEEEAKSAVISSWKEFLTEITN